MASTATIDVTALATALASVLQGDTPAKAETPKRSNRKANQKSKTKAEPKTAANPDRKASVGQWYSLARRMYFAATGETLPSSLTMGDVEALFAEYPLPPR